MRSAKHIPRTALIVCPTPASDTVRSNVTRVGKRCAFARPRFIRPIWQAARYAPDASSEEADTSTWRITHARLHKGYELNPSRSGRDMESTRSPGFKCGPCRPAWRRRAIGVSPKTSCSRALRPWHPSRHCAVCCLRYSLCFIVRYSSRSTSCNWRGYFSVASNQVARR